MEDLLNFRFSVRLFKSVAYLPVTTTLEMAHHYLCGRNENTEAHRSKKQIYCSKIRILIILCLIVKAQVLFTKSKDIYL